MLKVNKVKLQMILVIENSKLLNDDNWIMDV